jgi:hypothetical protein
MVRATSGGTPTVRICSGDDRCVDVDAPDDVSPSLNWPGMACG